MPDYFDRLIARGTRQPGGGTPAHGQPGRRAASASDPSGASGASGASGGAAVTFALPRLPGPFERPAAEPPDRLLEVVDEAWEVDAARPQTPRAWPAFGSLGGTQAAITPPPLLRDATTPRAPRPATSSHGEQPPARPATPQQAPPLPGATPARLAADAGAAAPEQVSARALLAAGPGEGWRGGQPLHAGGLRGAGPREVAGPRRMLAVPASAVRAARPAADETRTAQAQPPAPPPVTVRIGRIEVRNTGQDRRERQGKKRAGRAGPKQTLAEYLAAAGGRNGSAGGPGGAR